MLDRSKFGIPLYSFAMKMKGWIALDIDGTITLDKYSVPQKVVDYLRSLSKEGWRIAMATGRSCSFASMALSKFDFPYIFLPQNGSVGLEMPGKKLLFKKYLSASLIRAVEEAYEGFDSDFVIYAGYDKGDFCYWRPQRLSEEDRLYAENLKQREQESWKEVANYGELSGTFPLIKCFGTPIKMKQIADRLQKTGLFQVTRIRDPFHESYMILLVTDALVSKGLALKEVFQKLGRGDRVIAAGDDENDISMFLEADVKIAMSHAPDTVQSKADLIAPPTQDCGIIQALEMVVHDLR